MKKRLKDKIWHEKTIVIHRLVEQYKDDMSTENKAVCFLVTVKDGLGARTMFRADSVNELWKLLKSESRIYL